MNLQVKRLIIGLLLARVMFVNCFSQESGISLSFTDTELITILDRIEEKSGLFFLFNEKLIDTRQKVTINVSNSSINDLLDNLFSYTNIKYSVIDDKIILSPDFLEIKRLSTISGITSDEKGNPMPGVNIKVEGTATGVISDANGKYSVDVTNRDAKLIFSFVGYNQEKIDAAGRTIINVSLQPFLSSLEEVIVVGYGTIKKSDLTGSVAALSEDAYMAQPVSRVDDILQGRTAGVNVTGISGAPGGTTSIRIRGSNSITGSNEPLYVIDGFVGADIADVNPTDIETIQVLKDASSTAIYGSRGANGVILITTKRGIIDEPEFSVTGRYFLSNPLKLWPLLEAGEFAQVANERADALGYARPFTDDQVGYFLANGGTDWQDLIYRTAVGQEVQVDYSGGNDAVTYFISGNVLEQDGIIINSDFKRYSLRTNIDAKLSRRLRGSLKLNFARRETNNTSGDYNTSGVVAGATAWAPTTPAYDSGGKLTTLDPVSSIKINPIELATNDIIDESNTVNTVGNFIYQIARGLNLDLGFGVNYNNTQGKMFNQNLRPNSPSAARSSNESIFLQNTNILTYTTTLYDIHSITLTGVAEYQWQQNDYYMASASNLLFPFLKYNNITLAQSYALDNGYTKSTIGSYIGRVNYNLLNRYLVTASVRSDRSSKFRGKNQTSVFPSVGLGWRISEEEFMQGIPVISNLKLRASWGQTGSQAVNVYGTVTSYNTSAALAGTSWQNGMLTSGINIGNPGNEHLRWETTAQTNVGFDLGLLKDRITLEADYFLKNTTDLLLSEPLPGYVGGGSIYRNVGAISNKGFELNLNARLFSRNDLSWSVNFNITFLDNKVKTLGETPYILLMGGAGAGMLTNPEMILKPGYSISSYYGFRSLGIWQAADAELAARYGNQPGDYRYEDLNGDYAITGSDFQIIGSGMPRKVLGLNNTIRYRNFILNAFFQSMLDYGKWNFAYAQIMVAAADAREFVHKDILNRWSPDNPTSRVAAFNKTNVPRIQSSEYIESGNYLRLKNISLQYTLPKNVLRWGDLTATISAQNLFTITKYKGIDPETYSNVGSGDLRGGDGGAYPGARTWTFGLALSF